MPRRVVPDQETVTPVWDIPARILIATTFVVLITTFAELTTPRFHSEFQVRERHDGELLTHHLELHLVELPKLPSALDTNEEPELILWGKFLSAVADIDFENLAMQSPVLKQAKAALDRLSADEVAQIQAEQREMALLTYEAGIAAAQEEARNEARAEMLLRLLTRKFGPQSARFTQRLAGAGPEELLRWSERVLFAETLDGVFE